MVFSAIDAVDQVVLHAGSEQAIALTQAIPQQTLLNKVGTSLNETGDLDYTSKVAENTPAEVVETHTLTTPHGKDFKLTLADGTIVWLNAESRLEYPSRFVGSERRVKLTGEAYFQVTKDASHPFVVETEQLQARVLGTELNVRSYKAADSQVTLINGKVEVCADPAKNEYTQLLHGENALLCRYGSFPSSRVALHS